MAWASGAYGKHKKKQFMHDTTSATELPVEINYDAPGSGEAHRYLVLSDAISHRTLFDALARVSREPHGNAQCRRVN